MGIIDIFKPLKKTSVQRWEELGSYKAVFSVFGDDIFNNDIVRACIRPLADLSSKAEAKCGDPKLEKLLNCRPNIYMNGTSFLKKVRTRLEILNTAFIYIQRNDRLQVVGLYPVPYSYFEALEYANGLFIKFYFASNETKTITLPWNDLAVLRKDYNRFDISGDDNSAIIEKLQLMMTADQGLANSIRSTANLRGILKSTKAMLAPEAVKEQANQFVSDYLNLENSGGIASLDSTQEFTPINMNPSTATADQRKDIREDIYRYFGVNESIVTGSIKKSEEMETFYQMRIEPFLVDLSRELTSKIYQGKAAAVEKNKIIYQADQFAFVSLDKKIQLFSTVVLYGGMTIDEWRALFNLGHIEGGDKPIRRLDSDYIDRPKENDDEEPKKDEDSKDE